MTDDRPQARSRIGRAGRFLRQEGRRVGVGIAGGVIVVVGIVLMPLPGPGLLVVLAGLAVLATQFEWARDLLDRLRERARHVLDRWRDDDADGDRSDRRRGPDPDDRRESGPDPVGDRSDVA